MGDEVEQEEVGGNGNGGNKDGGNGNGGNRDGGNGNGGNEDGGNGNGGNGNGNRNGGECGYNFRGFMPSRECTYQDFLKCQPLNFNGTEGVVGLTRWFEKMETVFRIRNCLEKYQVKYASCTLLNSTLTWWNSHKRMIGNEAAYAMSWAELIMVLNEEDKVERFIGGLPDNIQGNVIAANPARFQDDVRIANQLMDKKLQGYAAKSAESKRRMESNSKDNCGQQPPFKRQNISGQNVVKAYTTRNNERRGDCKATITPNTQRAPVGIQQGVVCYECGRPGHFRKDCPKLRNQNRGNKTRNKVGNKTGNHTGGNEATVKTYAIGGGGINPDSNVVMDTSYAIELADGRISETNVVLRGLVQDM
ncbi:putative reverse transcriptase domain-containing protein, partial [Tanacetum coccineum]